jgi:hypothetical protein
MNTLTKFLRLFILMSTVIALSSAHAQVPQPPIVVAKPDTSWMKNMEKMQKEMQMQTQEAYGSAMKDYDIARGNVWRLGRDEFALQSLLGQEKPSSQLTLHKSFESETASKKTSFLVDEASNYVSFSVEGECEQGEIRILIKKPTGETLQEVVIDPSAGVEWSQSFQLGSGPALFFYPENKKVAVVTEKSTGVSEKEAAVKIPEKNKSLIGNWQIEINAKNAKGYYSLKIYAR